MKLIQKTIIIKVIIILSVALIFLNISQFYVNNNNNKINLKQRDIKFYVDNNQNKNNHLSFNNNNNDNIDLNNDNKNPINIDINNNNKNTIIDESNTSIEEVETPLSSSDQLSPSSSKNNLDMVLGEAPKYTHRFCNDKNEQDLDL